MPIDLRLVRSADGVKQVEQWHKLRLRTPNDALKNVISLDKDLRQAQKTLNSYKSSCRQERKRPDAELMNSYQKECDDLSTTLQEKLCTISNLVDETVLSEMEQWQAACEVPLNRNLAKGPYRRLVELGAWEAIGNIQSNSGMLCWTGLGMRWANAISRYLVNVVQSAQQETQFLQLPTSLDLERKDLHGMMGCEPDSHRECSTESAALPAPSWLGYLKLQYSDKTLGDKQLPKILQYTERRHSSGSPLDSREQLRQRSLVLPTVAASAETTVHHILILTSSTYYDSRETQKKWARRLLDFYRSLLPPNRDEFVRLRVTGPAELMLAEVSRVVVEGFVTGSGTKGGHWMILAHLSNFSDFPTRACRTKNNQQQFCHVLEGTICSIPETMCWQASHGEGDVAFPEKLAEFFPGHAVVHQVKKLETTKNGRLQIRNLSNGKDKDSEIRAKPAILDTKLANAMKKKINNVMPSMLEVNTTATPAMIQGEALSSPFSFIPFFNAP